MFMKVRYLSLRQRKVLTPCRQINSLEASNAGKNKSKDIHLPSIDVNFGSNRILYVLILSTCSSPNSYDTRRSGASLTLAYGRRYGLIGRNGVGKSTLLRHIALREVPIPAHITILFVEQEIVGDDTIALDSVLKADVWRDTLLREEASLNAKLAELESEGDDKVEDVEAFGTNAIRQDFDGVGNDQGRECKAVMYCQLTQCERAHG